MLQCLSLTLLLLPVAHGQTDNAVFSGSNTFPTTGLPSTSIPNLGGDLAPTGTRFSYQSLTSTVTLSTGSLSGETALWASTIAVANGSATSTIAPSVTLSSSSTSFTLLQGSVRTTSPANGTSTGISTSTQTSAAAEPINTQPCNNYPELCTRKYSNVTEVAAHNSPFVTPNNAAANQALGVIDQLNDGIRMLQGQTHMVNNTLFYCHTSCDLLNAGTAESYFTDITRWVRRHPYDVVTLLIGNADLVNVNNYAALLQSSRLARYAYIPSEVPMGIDAWPTLSEMILTQKRVVIFMDYNANQTAVPYILDEFSYVWETPFSPTNRSFPCTQQRPPGLSTGDAQRRMYLVNHNLNTELTLAGTSILVVTVSLLNVTNNVTGPGSLGTHAAKKVVERWSRPPNFLLVDYYNVGAGSVFKVAAELNNVTYDRACCGTVPSRAISLRCNGGEGGIPAFALGLAMISAMMV
ncbi:MAG: hypothetical protein LQ345_002230 [Seirophora villosa]|nr:MAG: hypothetical protein LQ345_002230 [Seirophora villosa]